MKLTFVAPTAGHESYTSVYNRALIALGDFQHITYRCNFGKKQIQYQQSIKISSHRERGLKPSCVNYSYNPDPS